MIATAQSQYVEIGPVTEARLRSTFADASVISANATATLIGCDVKTLREMTKAGVIHAVRKGAGKTRGYTEGDTRAYLRRVPALRPPSCSECPHEMMAEAV